MESTNLTSEEIILDSVNMANLAINSPETVKLDLLHKYELLADTVNNSSTGLIEKNAFNYSVMMNKTLFITLVNSKNPVDLLNYTNLNSLLQSSIRENNGKSGIGAVKKLYSKLEKIANTHGVVIQQCATADQLQSAIETFGVDQISSDELEDMPFEIDIDDSLEDMIPDEAFDEDIVNEDDTDINMDDILSEDDNIDLSEEDIVEGDGSAFDDLDNLEDLSDALNDLNEQSEKEEKEETERKEQLGKGKIAGTASDITPDETSVDDEEIEALVNNVMNNIISAYAKIYQPLFNNPPRGVLYTNEAGKLSIMTVGNSETHEGVRVHELKSLRLFVAPMYSAIKQVCGDNLREAPKVGDDGMDIKAEWMNRDGSMVYNYAPHIQVRNCMGVWKDRSTGKLNRAKTWSEFKDKLTKDLKNTIRALLKRVDLNNDAVIRRAVISIQEIYTSILLINEFDPEKVIRLTAYCTSVSNKGQLTLLPKAIINSNPLNKDLSEYKLMNSDTTGGILQTLIVTDVNKYRGEINFAYKTLGKIVRSGGSIDIQHTIVGTDLSGTPVELNLANNAYVSIGIVAGTRSGKGVLTMSLLASILAARCPIVYLDYKPDMAGTFWKLERKYGVKTLAIDGQTSKLDDCVPVRNYKAGYGVPPALSESVSDKLNVIPYVKGVQLMNLLGIARVTGLIPRNRKAFFVLDEAQKCSEQIASATKAFEEVKNKYKPGKGKEEPPEYTYMTKLSGLFSTVEQAATTFLNTNGGLGNMSTLILGQQADAKQWRGPLGTLMLKCAVKFLGTGTVGGSQYGLNTKISGVDMIGTGYFGLAQGNVPTETNTKIIKTTLVLNDADFDASTKKGGKFTGALLNNITNPDLLSDIINNDMMVSESNEIALSAGCNLGDANPLVGFPGLIEYIGNNSGDYDIQEALGAGYKEVEAVLHLLGIVGKEEEGYPYQNVESYMYSARADSLFTTGQLSNALNNNINIYEYLEHGLPDNESGLISDETADGESEQSGLDEDEELLAMGASGDSSEGGNGDGDTFGGESEAASTEANTSMSEADAFSDFRNQRANENKQDTNVEIPKFTFVHNLQTKNLTPDQLSSYIEKYRLADRVVRADFDFADRSNTPNKKNLAMATIVIGNYVYITNQLGTNRAAIMQDLGTKIQKMRDVKSAIVFGMIRDLESGALEYDQMPSQNQMQAWTSGFIGMEQGGTSSSVYNTNTANSSETVQFSDNLMARILRLSLEASKGRNWSSEDLMAFQQMLLEKMGVR